MADRRLPPLPDPPAELFPFLTPAQAARLEAHGRRRTIPAEEIAVEVGTRATELFVVLGGAIEILRVTEEGEQLVAACRAGQFTGEANLLSGRPGVLRLRTSEPTEVLAIPLERLQSLLQTDSELSDVLMRAFLLRRVELIARGYGEVLIGSTHSPDTLRVREFLTRNGHPHTFVDVEKEPDVQGMLDRFHVKIDDVPVLICGGTHVLRNPSNRDVADCLGFNAT